MKLAKVLVIDYLRTVMGSKYGDELEQENLVTTQDCFEYLVQYKDEYIFHTPYSDRPNYRRTFNTIIKEMKAQNLLPKDKNYVLYSM